MGFLNEKNILIIMISFLFFILFLALIDGIANYESRDQKVKCIVECYKLSEKTDTTKECLKLCDCE